MTSPAVGLSPIATPAMLQGELAPWGPTPSPSPLMRFPMPIAEGSSSRGASTANATPEDVGKSPMQGITQELLLSICSPFLEHMVQALYVAIEKQLEGGSVSGEEGSEKGDSTPKADGKKPAGAQNDPFRSLFDSNAAPNLGRRAPFTRKGAPPCDSPLEEEPEEILSSDDSPLMPSTLPRKGSHTSSPADSALSSVLKKGGPEKKETTRRPEERVALSTASPHVTGREPGAGLGRPGSKEAGRGDLTRGDRSAAAAREAAGAAAAAAAVAAASLDAAAAAGSKNDASSQPLYLAWSNPGVGADGRGAGQRWADQRLSPSISPMLPSTHPSGGGVLTMSPVMPSTQPKGGGMLLERLEEEGPSDTHAVPSSGSGALGFVDSAAAAAAAEKSVMVCRHWKSKGWCRLEDSCKFLHPQHKRGTGSSNAKETRQTGSSSMDSSARPPLGGVVAGYGAGQVGQAGMGPGPPAAGNSRSSRRTGRSRAGGTAPGHGSIAGNGPLAPAAPPGAVAAGALQRGRP
eukprot:TRINITY_DN112909_c0_g1_i1.p1 TRINITY_DN112909_c0_g1~~TRINITY_DN112909_c0_g1_i1.p1  ORF type:complete len:518 (+),score=71.71 TRINITY_DN112909_c0_g1_i1:72-1625(+)